MSVLITGFGTVGAAVALVFADSGYDVVVYSSEQNSPRTRLMLDGYGDSINMVPGDIRHLSHHHRSGAELDLLPRGRRFLAGHAHATCA